MQALWIRRRGRRLGPSVGLTTRRGTRRGVTETESLKEPVSAPVGDALIAGEEDLAVLVERVSPAAPVPEFYLLDSPAYGVQAPLSARHDVEPVGDLACIA